MAIFKLNDRFLVSDALGKDIHIFDAYNENGTLMAEDYELAYYFRVENWATYLPEFRWYDGSLGDESNEGFNVKTIDKFYSKSFCLDFAQCIIEMKGTDSTYLGKSALGIAKECYAHAIVKALAEVSIALINRGYSDNAQAREIGYVAKDPNSWKYMLIWEFFKG